MRKLFFYLFLLSYLALNGQIQHPGLPYGKSNISSRSATPGKVTTVTMPAFELPEEDENPFSKSLTFAHTFEVDLGPENSGEWQSLEDGTKLWQLSIVSEQAKSINLIFEDFELPEGAQMFIYNSDMSHIIGAFTAANNKASGILPTLPVRGDEITVEYQEPADASFSGSFRISQVNHDYSDVFTLEKSGYFGDAQSCEKDVSCYVDELYQLNRRSTLKLIINGSELMTGTLINNAKEDGTPYVLTAAHGFEAYDLSAEKTIFIFNYEVPLCYSDVEGNREQAIAGGSIRAYSPKVDNEALDFALVEMSVSPPTAYRPYYAGWNRSSSSPDYAFCIHHPQGDVKKISFEDDPLSQVTLNANSIAYYPNGHWLVSLWEEGVTEGGSSGSAIFNPQGQVIGALSAGAATCSNPINDYFFRFDLCWDSYADSSRQLAYWLDPDTSDIFEIGAYESPAVSNTERLSHIHDSSDVVIAKTTDLGYIAGNNSRGISHFVEKFESQGEKQILGLYFVAAEGQSSSIVNTSIWTGDDEPENEVYNESLLIKSWAYIEDVPSGTIGGFWPKDSLDLQESFIYFEDPITVEDNYFVGFEVDNESDAPDFGLLLSYTNSEDNAYYYDTQWHPYSALSDYNKASSLWIDPVVLSEGISSIDTNNYSSSMRLYPNPIKSQESLFVEYSESSYPILIYDLLGRAQNYTILNASPQKAQLNVDALSAGIYILSKGQERILFEKK